MYLFRFQLKYLQATHSSLIDIAQKIETGQIQTEQQKRLSKVSSNLRPWTAWEETKSPIDIEKLTTEASLAALFKCMATNCNFTSNDSKLMQKHLSGHQSTNQLKVGSLECCYCEFDAISPQSLVDHIQNEHSTSIYQCAYCFYRSADKGNVISHVEHYHSNKDIRILICGSSPKFLCDDIDAIRTAQTKSVFESIFQRGIAMQNLFRNCERYSYLFCLGCGDIFEQWKEQNVNERSEASIRQMYKNATLYRCVHCAFHCLDIGSIRDHVRDTHATKLAYALVHSATALEWSFNTEARIICLYRENQRDAIFQLAELPSAMVDLDALCQAIDSDKAKTDNICIAYNIKNFNTLADA